MAQKVVGFPKAEPRDAQKKDTQFEKKKHPQHVKETLGQGVRQLPFSEGGQTLGDIAVVDVHAINLREALAGGHHIPSQFLRHS